MKNTRFLGFYAFILVMILCNEIIVCVEGRHLRATHHHHHCKKQCSKGKGFKNSLGTNVKGSMLNENGISSLSETNASKVEYVEDFRPTAPGRSPGVGHFVHD